MTSERAERAIVLLRGVNVGGRQLAMSALRVGLEEAGCADVATYIQSGNVVLIPPCSAPENLPAWLEGIITDLAGFEVPVVLRTLAELEQTVALNPYPHAAATQLHVVFHAEPPDPAAVESLDLNQFAPESCRVVGRDVYLCLPNGMGRAKLPVALGRLWRTAKSSPGTARNWNTVLKLVALAKG